MSLDLEQPPRRRRQVDHADRDARRAVASCIDRLGPWRVEIAQMAMKATRPTSTDDRIRLLGRCEQLRRAAQVARTELLAELVDMPRAVKSSGRVVDAEKAFDNFERSLAELCGRLESAT